jgi:uncharacterized membrane protein
MPQAYLAFLNLCFLFIFGGGLGWVIEVFFRRFFSAHRWMNPGFLKGPFLPLYGFGLLFLFLLSSIDLGMENKGLQDALIVFFIALAMTLVEYIAGLIFIKGMNIKLWDYTKVRGNIQGIICPLFSLIWAVIGALYFFFLHKYFVQALNWFDTYAEIVQFWVGICYGLLIYDVIISFNLGAKIAKMAKTSKVVISYEQFKLSRQEAKKKHREEFMSENTAFTEFIQEQKKRSEELIGRVVYIDESSKAVKAKREKEAASSSSSAPKNEDTAPSSADADQTKGK